MTSFERSWDLHQQEAQGEEGSTDGTGSMGGNYLLPNLFCSHSLSPPPHFLFLSLYLTFIVK